jgi:flagellar basal-body rod protein FlgF/flagellar basal-body rod protein FlgG
MDSGYYAACAGLMSRTQALDTIANNLANSSTTGFRATHNVFRSLLAESESGVHQLSVVNQDANDYGVLGSTQLDTTQGSLTNTGNEMDLAIQGSGYFQVQTSNGVEYTRGGSLRISAKGQLVTASGDPVLGSGGAPINVPGGGPFTVSADGTITAKGAIVGRLQLVEFAPNVAVQSVGQGYYTAQGSPSNGPVTSQVRQGMLESSNVNPITSVIEMISAQRELEGMRRALSMFNNEIDKTAVQDLPHVS